MKDGAFLNEWIVGYWIFTGGFRCRRRIHDDCSKALLPEPAPLLPDVVLPELAYMVLRELGYSVLTDFLRSIHKGELTIARTNLDDLVRTSEILEKYADDQVDFVDCAIAAMAERLNIQRILTVDHRHFRIFRPKHCKYFIIIPESI
ncbi:MAG: PIN domain-containing protein [Calditrichaceae bacterium]|nr:PIN domain-containing protein [Calditrichia bacterium]NUQ42748.1 PIN domain-containing protein [Calditrichaceae bacterium]